MAGSSKSALMSMSGYGRANVSMRRSSLTCEVKSTNHRYLDLSLDMGPELGWAEPDVRRKIADRVRRGRVEVRIVFRAAHPSGLAGGYDEKAARAVATRLRKLAEATRILPPRADSVVRLPGVQVQESASFSEKRVAAMLDRGLDGAMTRMLAMRKREGGVIATDLLNRASAIAGGVERVETLWPEGARKLRAKAEERLREMLERAGDNVKASAAELVALAEKGDAAEEITRLWSHLKQLTDAVRKGGPAGRRLDFLAQEIIRELHTLGAKSPEASISHIVVGMKEEAERIREQAQNAE